METNRYVSGMTTAKRDMNWDIQTSRVHGQKIKTMCSTRCTKGKRVNTNDRQVGKRKRNEKGFVLSSTAYTWNKLKWLRIEYLEEGTNIQWRTAGRYARHRSKGDKAWTRAGRHQQPKHGTRRDCGERLDRETNNNFGSTSVVMSEIQNTREIWSDMKFRSRWRREQHTRMLRLKPNHWPQDEQEVD